MSIPSSLRYPSVKPPAVLSYATTYQASPVNTAAVYPESTDIVFQIPCGQRNQFLNCANTFIKFSAEVTMTGGTAPKWSALPFDFIKAITVSSSGQSRTVEQNNDYALTHTIMRQCYSDEGNVMTSDSVMLNSNINGALRGAAYEVSGIVISYALPLLSVVGLISNIEHLLPINALRGGNLTLTITLNSALQALATTGAPATLSYSILKPVLHLGLVNVADQAAADIAAIADNVYRWSSVVYKVFRNQHPAGQATGIYPITAQFSSLKAIMIAMRESSSQENNTRYSINDFVRNKLTSYWLKVNSSYATARAVDTTGNAVEPFMAMRECMGSSAVTSEGVPGLVTRESWTKDASTTVAEDAVVGSFLACNNLSPFSNDSLTSGTNSVGSQLSVEMQFSPTALNDVKAVNIDSLCIADCVYKIEQGELLVSF
jgi:hypothetical protein